MGWVTGDGHAKGVRRASQVARNELDMVRTNDGSQVAENESR